MKDEKEINRVVVRIRTTAFKTKRGSAVRKDIYVLKKQCLGFNFFEEEISQIGMENIVDRIVNLNQCDDGVYEMMICNESRDWETGYVDDYDFKLVSFP